MRPSILLIVALLPFAAVGDNGAHDTSKPSIEILGTEITRGMPESEVRKALYSSLRCQKVQLDIEAEFDEYCSVSDGVPPGEDGSISFANGYVHSTNRTWFFKEGLGPLDVLKIVHDHLSRLAGEDQATCAKIETISDQEPNYTLYAFPRKYLAVQMHFMSGRSKVFLREGLRVHPVPDGYKTRGEKHRGTEWCGYVN